MPKTNGKNNATQTQAQTQAQEQAQTQGQQSPKSTATDDVVKCLKELTELGGSLKEILSNHENKLFDHEVRIVALETMNGGEPKKTDQVTSSSTKPDDKPVKQETDCMIEKCFDCADGPREFWKWKDPKSGLFRGPVESIVTAKHLSAVIKPYYVWVENGQIKRSLTSDEVEKFF